jgi:hypothetical protein
MSSQVFPRAPLSQVVFVHDYVQLYFQDDILTIYNDISLQQSNAPFRTGAPGFCDALIRLIGASVVRSSSEPGQPLQLWFGSGDTLVVDTNPRSGRPDAWMYGPVGGPWSVES